MQEKPEKWNDATKREFIGSAFENGYCKKKCSLLVLIAMICIIILTISASGWNDVGWHNDFMPTPNLNTLAREGVILDNMYSQPICTPSRVALMTGKYPAKVGMQHFVVLPMRPYYLPGNYATLAEKLKEQGYTNHIVGKWHLGSCDWKYTPMWRGFDSHYGCHEGVTSNFETHMLTWPPVVGVSGRDLRDNTGLVTHENGTHNTMLFSERAERIVKNHNPESPLFLYVPYMAPHFPLQAPQGFEEAVQLDDTDRRTFAGMMAAMDQGVGNITQALKDKGMWDDTLFVFLSDNGGDKMFAGSNYPYRGNKATMWEGGVKVPAFIRGNEDIDGKNQWDSFCKGKPSKRSEILLHLDEHPVTNGAALRMGDYKYMEGVTINVPMLLPRNDIEHFDQWFTPAENPDASTPDVPPITENVNNRYLFNIKDDPLETNNLYNDPAKQEIINEMKQRLDEFRTSVPPFWFPGEDESGNPDNFGGAWSPGWC
ncbi:arylsulfatase B-like [Saccoglossus kowalevskii]